MHWWRRTGSVLFPLLLLGLLATSCASTEEGKGVVVTKVRYFGKLEEKANPQKAEMLLSIEVYRKRWKTNTADPTYEEVLSEAGPMPAAQRSFKVSYLPEESRKPILTKQLTTDGNGKLLVAFPSQVMKLGQEKKGAWLYLESVGDETPIRVEFKEGAPRVAADTLALMYFHHSKD